MNRVTVVRVTAVSVSLSVVLGVLAVPALAKGKRAPTAPGSYTEFAELAAVKEDTGSPDAKQMIRNLVADQETVVEAARRVVESAEGSGDQATADLGVRRIQVHEKNAWMLRSHLE